MKALKVLVTRPEAQAQRFGEALARQGFEPVLAPMLDIVPFENPYPKSAISELKSLVPADRIIAISTNAFALAWDSIEKHKIELFPELRWYAVGEATATLMQTKGLNVGVPEIQFDSEGVLALEDFASESAGRCVILAGRGGRRKLENELQARGFDLLRLEFYERKPRLEHHIVAFDEPDVLTVMSVETLDALSNCLSMRHNTYFDSKTLLVPSSRVAQHAIDCGYRRVRVSENASEKSVLQALCRLASEV